MAYTVTWVLTRPNEDTELPTISGISAANKSESDTLMADNSVSKTYQIDGLVTRVIYEFADKAAHDALDFSSTTDHSTVRTNYKQTLIDRGITCVITDSDGVEIANY